MDSGPGELNALRAELDEVDAGLVRLAARRQALVSRIGRFKQDRGQQLRDFRREREVLELVRGHAESADLDPDLAESLFRTLIEASLTRQEHERVRVARRGQGQRALIIGGNGRMGRWLAGFLDNQGHAVMLADPTIEIEDGRHCRDWRDAPLDVSLIAVAAPPRETAGVIEGLAERRVPGLVIEVSSIKTPVIGALESAARAGLDICALHPMFGPDTRVLSGRRVLFMDAGCPRAIDRARALFADTMAELVTIPLAEHDRLISLVLGLSHALNIAFFTALVRSGVPAEALAGLSSTTFSRQLAIAGDVASENPALYHEIQHLNAHGHIARDALKDAIDAVCTAADRDDDEVMRKLMAEGQKYLGLLER